MKSKDLTENRPLERFLFGVNVISFP